MLKAFLLCDNITDNSGHSERKNLQGAGISHIECEGPFPVKLSFWVFIQLSDEKEVGEVRLAIMRADSGRRYLFHPVTVRHPDPVQTTIFAIRLHDCEFPKRGVYFVELWYDNDWVIDQRLELI